MVFSSGIGIRHCLVYAFYNYSVSQVLITSLWAKDFETRTRCIAEYRFDSFSLQSTNLVNFGKPFRQGRLGSTVDSILPSPRVVL